MRARSVATQLRFNGSAWVNVDIALRNLDQLFGRVVQPLGLTVIEWYILRALMERDGLHASELARAVGRAATSFTPNLDKLANRGLIERRPDESDRRAVRIYLTTAGENHRDYVQKSSEQIDQQVQKLFNVKDFETFQTVLATLQSLEPDYNSDSFRMIAPPRSSIENGR